MKRKYILFGGFVVLLLFSLFLLNYNPYNFVLGTQEGELNSTVIELIIIGLSGLSKSLVLEKAETPNY